MKYDFEKKISTEIFFTKINKLKIKQKSVIIADKIVFDLYPNLRLFLKQFPVFLFDADEKNKSFDALKNIFNFFQNNKINRSFDIIGIGGGVTSDIVALSASLFMRGCNLILIPTTLLGMVDASLGGKTAVNFNKIKNNIGSFYPAGKVIIDISFLKTLPEIERQNGWVEIIKTSLISKGNLFDKIIGNEYLEDIIKECVRIKMEICEKDILDKNERRFLNFGHTFAHIIESYSGFTISHGQAVYVGMKSALFYGSNFLNIKYEEKIKQILKKIPNYKFDLIYPNLEEFTNLIISDKKNNENINLVLLKKIGEPFLYSVKDLGTVLYSLKNNERFK